MRAVAIGEKIIGRDDPFLRARPGRKRLMVGEAVADDRQKRVGDALDLLALAMAEIADEPRREPRQIGPSEEERLLGSRSIAGALRMSPGTVTGTIEHDASTPPLP